MVIGKAALTVTGNSLQTTYNGQTQSVSGYTVSGMQGTDTTADLEGIGATGASARNVGVYTNTVSTGTLANYTVTLQNGHLQVQPKTIQLVGTPTQVNYSGLMQYQQPASLMGAISSDDVSYTGLAQGSDPGTYFSRLALTGRDAANYKAQIQDAALVITRNIEAGKPLFKMADQRNIERVTRITLSGFNGASGVGAVVAGRKDFKQFSSAMLCTPETDEEDCTCQTPADSGVEICTSPR